jgi:class 3 adenylate cyclase
LIESQTTFDKAIEIARSLGDEERLGRAVLGRTQYFEVGVVREDNIALLDEALARVGDDDSAVRALLLSGRGREEYFRSFDERAKYVTESVAVARRVGDKVTLATCLFHAAYGSITLWDADKHLLIANEVEELAREIGNKELLARGHFMQIGLNLILGNFKTAHEYVDRFVPLAEELRLPELIWFASTLRAMQAFVAGRVEEAEALATQALEKGRAYDPANVMVMYTAQMLGIRREQARAGELSGAIKAAVAQFPLIPAYQATLAFNCSEAGELDDARREFEVLAKDDFATIPLDGNWPIAMLVLSQACATLGDKERAAILYDKIAPYADRCVVVGTLVNCYGALGGYTADLAATMERWDDAEREFEAALVMNVRNEAVAGTVWTQCRYAKMLLARDAEGDRRKALDLLAKAIDTAQPLGMKRVVDVCLELKLKAQGVQSTDIYTSIDQVAKAVQSEHPDLRKQAAPDGTVTIMFSDIEGSTALADRLGDARFMDVLREHNAIIRDQVKAHSGFEVKSEGDGFMVAFQSAAKALDCAAAIQTALAKRNETADECVQVRTGLHAGEVIKEGDDFFGRNVIMAARVASQANGGEILVSGVLKGLLSGSDISWGESRTVALKGLSGEHEIWAVEWAS